MFPSARPACARCHLQHQIRHASLLRRPKKPYTFTQLITLSDGSTFLHRTTSPSPIYRSTKDTKNSAMWNPSSQKLLNVEEDEAGRLKRFRKRFGRGWDAEAGGEGEEALEGEAAMSQTQRDESLLDLISGVGSADDTTGGTADTKDATKKGGRAKEGKK